MFAIKNQQKSLVERLLSDQQVLEDETRLDGDSIASCAGATGDLSLLQAARQAAARYIQQGDPSASQQARPSSPLSRWTVKEGYLNVAVRLLETKGRPVNVNDIRAWTLLHEAASQGNAEAVKFILSEKDANVHLKDKEGRTAFEIAACSGHERAVFELISGGADPHGDLDTSPTLLERVAEAGYAVIVRHMIEAGIDSHASGVKARFNALWIACQRGHIDAAEALPTDRTKANAHCRALFDSILLKACKEDHLVVVELLLGGDFNTSGSDITSTALPIAVQRGGYDLVMALLNAGADVNAPGGYNSCTALQTASENGNLGVVMALLNAGADINAPGDHRHGTALQAASRNGHLGVVTALLNAGADVNASHRYRGGTALQAASRNGSLSVVELLLSAGANVNAPGSNYKTRNCYRTAVHEATRGEHPDVVKALIEAGADVPVWLHEVKPKVERNAWDRTPPWHKQ